jgi:hypothetical protein
VLWYNFVLDADLTVLGVHTERLASELALQGDYSGSRGVALMNHRLAWRSRYVCLLVRIGIVVRAAGWHTSDPGSIFGRYSLYTFVNNDRRWSLDITGRKRRCISQRFESALAEILCYIKKTSFIYYLFISLSFFSFFLLHVVIFIFMFIFLFFYFFFVNYSH